MPPNFSDEDLSDVSEDWDSSGDEAVEKKEAKEAKLKAMEEASESIVIEFSLNYSLMF